MFLRGAEARIDDEVSVQRGPHTCKRGVVRERIDARLLVVPRPGANWTAFWIDDADVAVIL